ncbi:hypothetical protein L9F63_020427, partial [Diploptera punctata]
VSLRPRRCGRSATCTCQLAPAPPPPSAGESLMSTPSFFNFKNVSCLPKLYSG